MDVSRLIRPAETTLDCHFVVLLSRRDSIASSWQYISHLACSFAEKAIQRPPDIASPRTQVGRLGDKPGQAPLYLFFSDSIMIRSFGTIPRRRLEHWQRKGRAYRRRNHCIGRLRIHSVHGSPSSHPSPLPHFRCPQELTLFPQYLIRPWSVRSAVL